MLSKDLVEADKVWVPYAVGIGLEQYECSTREHFRRTDPTCVLWFLRTPGVTCNSLLVDLKLHLMEIYEIKDTTLKNGLTKKCLVFKRSQAEVITIFILNCLGDVFKTLAPIT